MKFRSFLSFTSKIVVVIDAADAKAKPIASMGTMLAAEWKDSGSIISIAIFEINVPPAAIRNAR